MGETMSMNAIDAADTAEQQVSRGAPVAKRHGNIVVDAISWPTRILMAGVIAVNLTLGVWFVQRADYSRVQPQGADTAAPAAAPTDAFRFEDDIQLVSTPRQDGHRAASFNERD